MRAGMALVRASFDDQIAYPANLAGHVLILCFYFCMQLAFFDRVFDYADALRGWSRGQVFVLLWGYVMISLAVDTVAPSVGRFFYAVHRGGIEPFLVKPVPVVSQMFLRWCQPVNAILFAAVALLPLVTGAWPAVLDTNVLRSTGYVVGLGLGFACNLSLVALLHTATLLTSREAPVDYIHAEVYRLSVVPTPLLPQRVVVPLVLIAPVAVSASVPAAVLVSGRFDLLAALGVATALAVGSTAIALRWALSRFEGLGG